MAAVAAIKDREGWCHRDGYLRASSLAQYTQLTNTDQHQSASPWAVLSFCLAGNHGQNCGMKNLPVIDADPDDCLFLLSDVLIDVLIDVHKDVQRYVPRYVPRRLQLYVKPDMLHWDVGLQANLWGACRDLRCSPPIQSAPLSEFSADGKIE